MTFTLIAIFFLFCGLFEVYLCQPETSKETELKKLGNLEAKLKSYWTREAELIRIARELVRLDEYDEAIPFFTKAIKNNPTELAYYQERGNCYSKMEKWSEAYSDFKKEFILYRHLRVGPKIDIAMSILLLLCSDLSNKNFNNEAILCLNEAIEKDPYDYVPYRERGHCYTRLKNYDLAKLNYRQALAKYHKDKESRISLIRVLFLDGKPEEAAAEMSFLNDVDLERLGDDFCNLKGKFREGILCYTEASKQSHLDPEYYLKRGSCYEKLNEMDEAINDYRNAVEKKPNDEFILEKLILALFKTKRIEEASQVIQGLRDDILKILEKRFLGSYRYEPAIPIISEAIERNPEDASKYNSRGNCYLGMGNLDSALPDFERAIKLAPKDTSYLFNQTETLFKMGRLAEAVEKLGDLDETQLQLMGDALIQEGKSAEALQCFIEVIRKIPGNSYGHEKAADCYWMNGDFEMAKSEKDKAINLLSQNNPHRTDLEITWCEKLVKAGKFPEARLALKNLEARFGEYGKPVTVTHKIAELRDKMEEDTRAHLASE